MDDNQSQKHGWSWTQRGMYCAILLKSLPVGKSSSRHSTQLVVAEVGTVVLHGMEFESGHKGATFEQEQVTPVLFF